MLLKTNKTTVYSYNVNFVLLFYLSFEKKNLFNTKEPNYIP